MINYSSALTLAVGDTYTELGAVAVDNRGGDITANITVSGTVETKTVGNYIITYSVTDVSGNTATEARTVIVQ